MITTSNQARRTSESLRRTHCYTHTHTHTLALRSTMRQRNTFSNSWAQEQVSPPFRACFVNSPPFPIGVPMFVQTESSHSPQDPLCGKGLKISVLTHKETPRRVSVTFESLYKRTHPIGANPEKLDLVNFRGPDRRKFSELCAVLFFLQKKTLKNAPQNRV